jgi:hypothetical protein
VPGAPWAVKVFVRHRDDDLQETCPAEEFLVNVCPESVSDDLQAIVDAVAASPPPQFTGGGMWEAMHGDLAGFYEARTRGPQRLLYRLFSILEHDGPGLEGPAIIVIDGLAKPVGTAIRPADYARVRALGDEYRRRVPRNAF